MTEPHAAKWRSRLCFCFLIVNYFFAQPLIADDNSAPEKPFSDPNYADDVDIPPPPPPKGSRRPPPAATTPARPPRKRPNVDNSDGFGGGKITISPGIGFGTGYVFAELAVTYYFSSYVATSVSGYYRNSKDDDDVEKIDYGPEVLLILLLPNPTVVTPFVGAGPGFQKWVIRKNDDLFDDNTSVTGIGVAGIDIGLSRHFALELASKTTYYVEDPPRIYPDQGKFEPKSQNRVLIGFKVSF